MPKHARRLYARGMWMPLLTIALAGSPPAMQQPRYIHHLQLRIENQRDDLRIDFDPPAIPGGNNLTTLLGGGSAAVACAGCRPKAGTVSMGGVLLLSASVGVIVVELLSRALERQAPTRTLEGVEGQLKTAERAVGSSDRRPRRFTVVRF